VLAFVRGWISDLRLGLPLLSRMELEELLVDYIHCGPEATRVAKAMYAGTNTEADNQLIGSSLDYLTREFLTEHGFPLPPPS
jgi:hypothetical protein